MLGSSYRYDRAFCFIFIEFCSTLLIDGDCYWIELLVGWNFSFCLTILIYGVKLFLLIP